MTLHDVRCDLCELPGHDPVWIYRTDQFAIILGTEPTYYRDGEEWGVCADCKDDVLRDKQNRVMRHRRKSAVDQFTGQIDDEAIETLCLMLDMTIIAFFAHRKKNEPGRAFGIQDQASAVVEVKDRGRDAFDRSKKPDTWPEDGGYLVEIDLPRS